MYSWNNRYIVIDENGKIIISTTNKRIARHQMIKEKENGESESPNMGEG